MLLFNRIRCFASILLIVIVLFHILMCVDAGFKFKSIGRGRSSIGRPIKRIPIKPVVIRPPIIRPRIKPVSIKPVSIKPSSKLSPLHGRLVHQPFSPSISRVPKISPTITHPKAPIKPRIPLKDTSSAMVLYKRPTTLQVKPNVGSSISNNGKIGSSNFLQAESGRKSNPIAKVNTNHLLRPSPSKPLLIKPTIPVKETSSAMVTYKHPSTSPVKLSQGSSIKPGSSSAGSSSSHSLSSATPQNMIWKPTVPLKSPSSIKKPYKPSQMSQMIQSQGTKLNRPSRPLITSKPTAPEQSISKITTTNVQSQSKPLTGASGKNYPAWANPHLRPQASGRLNSSPSSSLVTKPLTSSSSLKPYKMAQLKPSQQSISKPLPGASGKNYPAWANPYLRPQASGRLNSSPSSSLVTKPLTSSSSLTPYKMAQLKPSQQSIIKPQTASSISSSPHVTSDFKPKISSKPYTPYQGTSHSTSGLPSHIKPSTNQIKPGSTGSSTTSHGHPHHKPLPITPSTANQATISTQHHGSPIHEPAISNSHASPVMSHPNSHTHHGLSSAPITSTSQIQSSYQGANHPANAANYVPQHPPSTIQIVNQISNSAPPMGQHGGLPMGQYGGLPMGQYGGLPMGPYGGSQMGHSGGSGMGGIGRMVAESAVHSLVNTGIHKILNPSEPSNFNYATVPINPDTYQQAQVPAAASSAPSEESSIIHNNYYVDPNSANVASQGQGQGQGTSSQGSSFESGAFSVDDGSNQNPTSTNTPSWNTGNVGGTNGQQLIGQPFVEQNGYLAPFGEANENLTPPDNENGNLTTLDEENGNLTPLDEENGNLTPLDEENENLTPLNEENENLTPLNEENENLTPLDEENGNLTPSDEENGNLTPVNEENENLTPFDEENGNLTPLDEENENLTPLNEENENLTPLDEENENLAPLNEENENLTPSEEENGYEETLVEVVPVDNSELWELTEIIFGYEVNISQYINLNLQVSEFDSVAAIEATEPLLNIQEEAQLYPTIKALTDLFDNYKDDPTKTENIDAEKEDALLDEFLQTDAMITVMQFLEDRNYIAPNQWKETLQHLWMRRYNNSMSGFERIFLAEKSSDPTIFGGQNWIYFHHQEQSERIKYMSYQNSLNLADIAQLLKVNYQFDNVDQKSKAMLVGTSPHLEMALYTVCHYVRVNSWCTVSLADTKFGINTHAWIYEDKEMLDVGSIDF